MQALLEHGRRVAKTAALTDVLTPEAVGAADPNPSFRLAQSAGATVLSLVMRSAQEQSREPAALVHYVSLLRALAPLQGGLGKRADETAASLLGQLRTLKQPVGDQGVAPDAGLARSLASNLDTPAKNSADPSRKRVSTVCCAGLTLEILPILRQMFCALW